MTTALMPLDPAATPQHANRVLGIHARLLPSEITAGRNARRARFSIAGAVVLVVLVMGAWYASAVHTKSVADDANAAVAEQVVEATHTRSLHSGVTKVISDNEALKTNLKTLLTDDLRWSTLFNTLGTVGDTMNVQVTAVNGSLAALTATTSTAAAAATELPSTSSKATVLALTITGLAPDKNTVAEYADKLAAQKNFANVYVGSTADGTKGVTFTMTADITAGALCGRYTTTCPTGGK